MTDLQHVTYGKVRLDITFQFRVPDLIVLRNIHILADHIGLQEGSR